VRGRSTSNYLYLITLRASACAYNHYFHLIPRTDLAERSLSSKMTRFYALLAVMAATFAGVALAQDQSVAVSIFDSSDCSGNPMGGNPVSAPSGSCRTVPGISGVSFRGTCDSGSSGSGKIVACRSSDCTGTCSPSTSFSPGQCFTNLPGFPSNSVSVRCTNSSSGGNPGNGAGQAAISMLLAAGVGAIAGWAAFLQ
jgi:hypothetical protein